MGNCCCCSCDQQGACYKFCMPCINCCDSCGDACGHCCNGFKACCTPCSGLCEVACVCCVLDDCKCSPINCLNCNFDNPCFIKSTGNPEFTQLYKEFNYKGNYKDQYFGEIRLLEHKLSKELISLVQVDFKSPDDFSLAYEEYNSRLQLKHKNIIQLRFLATKSYDTFCSYILSAELFMDYLLIDLKTEVFKRDLEQLKFTENEIFALADGIIQGTYYLYQNRIQHGSLKSKNIYISQFGAFKVCDPLLFNFVSNYQKVFKKKGGRHLNIFLSPEQMTALHDNIEFPEIDLQKSDVFTMGMIILETACLARCSECYDYDSATFNQDKIEPLLQQVKSRYHDSLFYLIKDMLSINPVNRPSLPQLSEKMLKNPKAISAQQQQQQQALTVAQTPAAVIDLQNKLDIKSVYADPTATIINPIGNNANLDLGYTAYTPMNLDLNQPPAYTYNDYSSYSPDLGLGLGLGLGATGYSPFLNNSTFQSNTIPLSQNNQQKNNALTDVNEKLPNGCKYIGQKKGQLKHGQGKYIYSNGNYYQGQWKDNRMNGKGKLVDAQGRVLYDGTWENDQYSGNGTEYAYNNGNLGDGKDLSNVKYQKYVGDFKNDQFNGYGTLYCSNGDKYSGNFKNGKPHGQGSVTINGKTTSYQYLNGRAK